MTAAAGLFGLQYELDMKRFLFLWFLLLIPLAGCERPDPEITLAATAAPLHLQEAGPSDPSSPANQSRPANQQRPPTPHVYPPQTNLPQYAGTPTPDPPRPLPADVAGDEAQRHTVNFGESLSYIAQLYGTTVENLQQLNDLGSADFIYAGQELLIPGIASLTGPSFKIIPDSELVYGPAARGFDVRAAVAPYDGYLLRHREEVEGHLLDGPEIVQLVADRYSVNPRLLLAALEFRSGWVTQSTVLDDGYPMGYVGPGMRGLYPQLGRTANLLNWGYYGRAEGGRVGLEIKDGTRVTFAPDINDGTAGVQNWLGAHDDATYEEWLAETGPTGFMATFSRLFGNPFAYTVDPLWPANLEQPPLSLPWAAGETWYFTGGPHGGWASGSAWAALDFVPHDRQLGCYPSDNWVRSMSDGLVVRSGMGAVVVNVAGDSFAGSGWAITYMHIETRNRIPAGTYVQTGDPLGHPSCEGGFSSGTHVHVARTYNGRWVAADGPIPFVMSGWVSQGGGREYNGFLVRGDAVKEACQCREERNAITAD